MSTELRSLKGKIEIPNTQSMNSDYKETELFLNRFWGGTYRGTCLQITFLNEEGNYSHVQIDSENIEELKEILNTAF